MKTNDGAARTGSPCFTHHCEHEPEPWLAIHRETALEMLKGHNLTHEQQTDVGWLMAGYCRLLDEAKLIYYGQTEAEAVAKACELLPPNAKLRDAGESGVEQH